jgi:serine/threonine protein kinase
LSPVHGGQEGAGHARALRRDDPSEAAGYLNGVSKDVNEPLLEATQATDMPALIADQNRELQPEAVVAGRYRVDSMLGTGGMAHVVRATDLLLDREVAVKLLRETPDAEADLDRFLAETRTLARLSHPGLVTVLDGGTTESGRPYLVMELVDGPTLSASLETPLDPVRVAEVGAQVAAALAYAHTQGVVHRDVKPGNVLLRDDGRVKLADFGIAKLLGEQSLHTRTGTVLGSVHYLAPEQVAFEEITPAVDVYALGMLLLRCLTGHHAFEGPTIESALARLSADPEVPSDLPAEWRTLLTAMTARAPEDRPSAADVAGRLAWLSGAQATPRVVPPASAARPATAQWRVPGFPVAVAAGLLAVALLVASALSDDSSASDDPAAERTASRSEPERQVAAAEQPVTVPETEAVPVVSIDKATGPKAKPKAKPGKPKKDKGKPGKGGKGKGGPGKGGPGKGGPGKGGPGKR